MKYLKECFKHPFQYMFYLWYKYKIGPYKELRRYSRWVLDDETEKELMRNGWIQGEKVFFWEI